MSQPMKKNDNVRTPRALGCYVTLVKPRTPDNGGEPQYSLALLWDKKTDLTAIKKAILEAAQSKWGNNAEAALKANRLKNPLRDGDEKFAENGDEAYKGKVFLNAKSTTRPAIVDINMQPVDPADVYSGCEFHATLRFYPFDKNGNKGVGAGLQNLMLVKKGKRIDGRKSADQDFAGFTPDVRPEDESIEDML